MSKGRRHEIEWRTWGRVSLGITGTYSGRLIMIGSKAGERGRSQVCRNLYLVLKCPSDLLDGEDIGREDWQQGEQLESSCKNLKRFGSRPVSKAVSRKIGKARGHI